jgi:dipeptidyl aminopeptidase/acylaminoacyl peptidase
MGNRWLRCSRKFEGTKGVAARRRRAVGFFAAWPTRKWRNVKGKAPTRKQSRAKRWLIAAGLLGTIFLALYLALRFPQVQTLYNVAEYKVITQWESWFGYREPDPGRPGSFGGTVRDAEGQPLPGATVLVATRRGVTYATSTDAQGHYRIDEVPEGLYVPIAARWGYDERILKAVKIKSGQHRPGVDFAMPRTPPLSIATDDSLQIGEPERVWFSFENDGHVITGCMVYEPVDMQGPFPTLVMLYPGPALKWEGASIPFVAQGYVVMATGPLEERGKDVEGHVRDALKAVAFLKEGRLSRQADTTRMGMLGGSYSSLILFRVLRHTEDFAAAVSVGGVSDVFLVLYDTYYQEDYQPQPPFDRILMSLGRPNRHPGNYVPNSSVFYAADLPPLCLVHGVQDTTVLADQSIRLADQLQALGKPCELHLYPGTGHYPGVEDPTPETADMFEKILGFFDRYLKTENS